MLILFFLLLIASNLRDFGELIANPGTRPVGISYIISCVLYLIPFCISSTKQRYLCIANYRAIIIVEVIYVILSLLVTNALAVLFGLSRSDSVFGCNISSNCNGVHAMIIVLIVARMVPLLIVAIINIYVAFVPETLTMNQGLVAPVAQAPPDLERVRAANL